MADYPHIDIEAENLAELEGKNKNGGKDKLAKKK